MNDKIGKETVQFDDIKPDDGISEEVFEMCLKDKYKELKIKCDKKSGITKMNFSNFIGKIPVFIAEKIFQAFNSSKSNYMSYEEFCIPLITLKYGTYEQAAGILFNIFDFDHDGYLDLKDTTNLLIARIAYISVQVFTLSSLRYHPFLIHYSFLAG
jgi:Ca2+-binding EF-hand superfamily protein